MELASRTERWLGTEIEIKLPTPQAGLFSACFAEIARIEKTYSRFLDDSLLSQLNKKLGVWQEAPEEFISLLLEAQEFKEKTGGQFDITLKSTLDRLGYDKGYSFEPKPAPKPGPAVGLLQGVLKGLGEWGDPVQVDAKRGKILLRREIEFGGFGKGYTLDRVAALLDAQGVDHYYVNAGGDVFARRGRNGAPPWTILLEHPDDPTKAIGKMELDGQSLAGSAPNRRKWGKGLHHLINAKTGKPATGVKAIFVLAKTGAEADAYATALFCAGFEEGIFLSHHLPVELLMVSSEDKLYQSEGFEAELFR